MAVRYASATEACDQRLFEGAALVLAAFDRSVRPTGCAA